MAYDLSTYKALIEHVGEGSLADALLAKWLDDPDGDKGWENLATDMYHVRHNTKFALKEARSRELTNNGGGTRKVSSVPRWKVVLWYLSMGYQPKAIAVQLQCSTETIKTHIKYAQRDLKLPKKSVTYLVAMAIRKGIIP